MFYDLFQGLRTACWLLWWMTAVKLKVIYLFLRNGEELTEDGGDYFEVNGASRYSVAGKDYRWSNKLHCRITLYYSILHYYNILIYRTLHCTVINRLLHMQVSTAPKSLRKRKFYPKKLPGDSPLLAFENENFQPPISSWNESSHWMPMVYIFWRHETHFHW